MIRRIVKGNGRGREDGRGKLKVWREFAFSLVGIMCVCLALMGNGLLNCGECVEAADVTDMYRERLEFDENGNLCVTTHDKKATSAVTYRTLGWIIKRYNEPLGSPGQQYAVIKLNFSEIQYRDDPQDSGYKYCYYYADRDEIYKAIGMASKAWQKQLYQYGDDVYIDEVMTVCSNGVPLGTLLGNSSNTVQGTGEIYTSYAGIAGARFWASPESLMTHYDKRLRFPSLVEPPEEEVRIVSAEGVSYSNHDAGTVLMGHNQPEREVFQIGKGVPSNENLYVGIEAKRALYQIDYEKITGQSISPVRVITTYHYVWKDSSGEAHKEDVEVTRWYSVKRSFSYWTCTKFIYRVLKGGVIYNSGIALGKKELDSGCSMPSITLEHNGKQNAHTKLTKYVKTVRNDGGTVKGTLHRPAVPNDDFSKLAEKQVGEWQVWNDYLRIGSTVYMSKAKCEKKTSQPKGYTCKNIKMLQTGCHIPKARRNQCYESQGETFYEDYSTGNTYTRTLKAPSLYVHTPVVTNVSVKADCTYNQELSSSNLSETAIIGKTFEVSVGSFGKHRSIPGYGTRDYSKYITQIQVKFPFDVYEGKNYKKKKEWITISSGQSFRVPVGTPEGEYTVTCRVAALNAKTEELSKNGQKSANISTDYYSAYSTCKIYVTGRIYGLRLQDQKKLWHTVGTKNENGSNIGSDYILPMEGEKGNIPVSVTTVGDYFSDTDRIRIGLTWVYLKDGKRQNVEVYYKDGSKPLNNIYLTSAGRSFAGLKLSYGVENEKQREKGVQTWSGNIKLLNDLIAVPKGSFSGTVTEEALKKKQLTGGTLLLNLEIRTVREEKEILTYYGGYCNMWKKEGYSYTTLLRDGDSVYFGQRLSTPHVFQVIGTH